MSAPEGPDEPWEADPTAAPREDYYEPSGESASDGPKPYEPEACHPAPYVPPPPNEPPPYQPSSPTTPPVAAPPAASPPAATPPVSPPTVEPVILHKPPSPEQLPFDSGQVHGGPYGSMPPTAPPPIRPSVRTPLIIAAGAAVVLALAVIGIVAFVTGDHHPGGGRTNPQVQPPPVTSSVGGSPAPTSVKQITVPSVIPGWHGVLSYKENVAYDVPPDWKVETPGTLVGFEDSNGKPVAIMHGVSTYKDEACPSVSGSYRGRTGFQTSGDLEPATAAARGLKIFADGVALRDDGSSAPVSSTTQQTITVDQGKIRATYDRATVTLNDKTGCGSPNVVVVAVAFRSGPHATALFIGYFDQGVSDALPLTTAQQIFTTLRPYRH